MHLRELDFLGGSFLIFLFTIHSFAWSENLSFFRPLLENVLDLSQKGLWYLVTICHDGSRGYWHITLHFVYLMLVFPFIPFLKKRKNIYIYIFNIYCLCATVAFQRHYAFLESPNTAPRTSTLFTTRESRESPRWCNIHSACTHMALCQTGKYCPSSQ